MSDNNPITQTTTKGKLDFGLLSKVFDLLAEKKVMFYLAVFITLLGALWAVLIPK